MDSFVKNAKILKQHQQKWADESDVLVLDDYVIRNETTGPVMHDGVDKTRQDVFVLVALFVPDANSVRGKIAWIRSNWDWVQFRALEFVRNYIKTYYKDPLDDYIGIESFELLEDDPATRRSLSKAAFLVMVNERLHPTKQEEPVK